MQDLCESLTSEILSRVATADRWLLQFVCKQFRAAVKPTLQKPGDPRRRRVLDDVLEYAVANKGVATVRFLLDKKSCVWETAVEKAASNGDLETVRLVVGRGCAQKRAMMAALDGGHVEVAEYLLQRINLEENDRVIEEMFVSSVNFTDTLKWTVSKMKKTSSSGIKDPAMIYAFVKACWNSGNLECVQYLCNFFGKKRIIESTVLQQIPYYVFGKRVIPLSVLRFLGITFGYKIDLKRMCLVCNMVPFDDKFLDHVLESQGFDALLGAAAENVYVYAFLVGRGLIPRADLAAAASNVKYACELEVLMKLYPDLADWTEEAGLLKRLFKRSDLQTALVKFFRSQKAFNIDFDIRSTDKTAFDALRAMGGKCTSGTLYLVMFVSDDVELARSVWEAMDAQERDKFRSTKPPYLMSATDLGMLEFVALELQAVDRLREMNPVYTGQRSRFTVALARFLLEHRIKDSTKLLTEAVLCQHLDVVEMMVRASSCDEIWECMRQLQCISAPINADMLRVISDAILDKTHPVWLWLARWILFRSLPKMIAEE
jgi:hypothetical protein